MQRERYLSHFSKILRCLTPLCQIANICIQLNENPIVRYYLPSHHPAVGPLAGSSKSTAPQEGSGRWREALGVGPKVDTSNEDHLSKLLAFCVQEELDAYSRANPGWPDTTRPQSLMLITDRTMDMIAPFVHEFTYQAMCNDLLPISNGTKFRSVKAHKMYFCLKMADFL